MKRKLPRYVSLHVASYNRGFKAGLAQRCEEQFMAGQNAGHTYYVTDKAGMKAAYEQGRMDALRGSR